LALPPLPLLPPLIDCPVEGSDMDPLADPIFGAAKSQPANTIEAINTIAVLLNESFI
jgi:hypothetical protein